MKKQIAVLLSISLLSMNILYAYNPLYPVNEDFKEGGHVNLGNKKMPTMYPEHTYNPSRKIGESISDSGLINFYQKFNDTQNKINAGFNMLSKGLNLPVSTEIKQVQVTKGEISWSLVNPETCKPDLNAAFQGAVNDLLKRYKKMFQALMDGGMWRMWLLNMAYEGLFTGIALAVCMKEQGISGTLMAKNMQAAIAKYKNCLANSMKGIQKIKTGTQTGTSNTAKTEIEIDPAAQATAASSPLDCLTKATYDVFGKDLVDCVKKKREDIMSFMNGKVDLGLKMGLLNFRIEQQKCILSKYNTEISLQDVVTSALEIKKEKGQGNNANIIRKNLPGGDPAALAHSISNVLNGYSSYVTKGFAFAGITEPSFGKGTTAKILNFALQFYYTNAIANFYKVLFMYTGQECSYVDSQKHIKLNIPTGRWPFSTYLAGLVDRKTAKQKCGNLLDLKESIAQICTDISAINDPSMLIIATDYDFQKETDPKIFKAIPKQFANSFLLKKDYAYNLVYYLYSLDVNTNVVQNFIDLAKNSLDKEVKYLQELGDTEAANEKKKENEAIIQYISDLLYARKPLILTTSVEESKNNYYGLRAPKFYAFNDKMLKLMNGACNAWAKNYMSFILNSYNKFSQEAASALQNMPKEEAQKFKALMNSVKVDTDVKKDILKSLISITAENMK